MNSVLSSLFQPDLDFKVIMNWRGICSTAACRLTRLSQPLTVSVLTQMRSHRARPHNFSSLPIYDPGRDTFSQLLA